MIKYWIYTLSIDGVIIYVGKFHGLHLNSRLSTHRINNSRLIALYGKRLSDIVIEPLDTCVTKGDALLKERFWIEQMRCWGFPLLNHYSLTKYERPSAKHKYVLITDYEQFIIRSVGVLTISRAIGVETDALRLAVNSKKIKSSHFYKIFSYNRVLKTSVLHKD